MTRFDYLLSWSERRTGFAFPRALTPGLRIPLALLAAALLFAASASAIEAARVRAAERAGAATARRMAALAPPLARLHDADADVRALRAAVARDDALRRSGADGADAVAALGNALPADAWLTSWRADGGAVALDGRARDVRAIARALRALAAAPSTAAARLLSVRADVAGTGVLYAIALDPRP